MVQIKLYLGKGQKVRPSYPRKTELDIGTDDCNLRISFRKDEDVIDEFYKGITAWYKSSKKSLRRIKKRKESGGAVDE